MKQNVIFHGIIVFLNWNSKKERVKESNLVFSLKAIALMSYTASFLVDVRCLTTGIVISLVFLNLC